MSTTNAKSPSGPGRRKRHAVPQLEQTDELGEGCDAKREACFQGIDEYRQVTEMARLVARFVFCPETSEEYLAGEKYFETHGYRHVWG